MPRASKNASGLTAKRAQFCLLYFETGNATAAYKGAYDAEKMSPAAISNEAYGLLHNPEITLRLEKLHSELSERVMVGKMRHIGRLENLKRISVEAGDMRAAVKAEELIGKVLGHYVDQVEHGQPGEFASMDDEQLKAEEAALDEALAVINRARARNKVKVRTPKQAKV